MKLALCVLLTVLLAFSAAAADASGKWSGFLKQDSGDDGNAFLVLKQAGGSLTGTAGPNEGEQWPLENGKISGDKVTLQVKSPDGVIYKCELALAGDTLKGDVVASGPDGRTMKGKLELSRVK